MIAVLWTMKAKKLERFLRTRLLRVEYFFKKMSFLSTYKLISTLQTPERKPYNFTGAFAYTVAFRCGHCFSLHLFSQMLFCLLEKHFKSRSFFFSLSIFLTLALRTRSRKSLFGFTSETHFNGV